MKRHGSLLEKDVARLFKLLGFRVERNSILNGFEVDVYVRAKGLKIIIECKQYEKSRINITNLIYQWNGKNKKIGADKVIIVIYGQDFTSRDSKIGKEEDVILWGEEEIDKYLDLAINKKEDGIDDLLKDIGLDTEESDQEDSNHVEVDSNEERKKLFILILLIIVFWPAAIVYFFTSIRGGKNDS